MSSLFSIALTGLNDAARRIANSASNIVNASSISPLPKNSGDAYTGFAPQDIVTLSQDASGQSLGVTTASQPRNPAYVASYDPSAAQANAQGLVASPNVDPTNEIVSSNVAQISYGANAAVIKVGEKLEKTLLDALH